MNMKSVENCFSHETSVLLLKVLKSYPHRSLGKQTQLSNQIAV